MKASKIKLLSGSIFISLCIALLCCCKNSWQLPEKLTGKWSGIQPVSVRTKPDGKWHFDRHDSIEFNILVNKNGSVEGNLGNAQLADCRLTLNRHWLGRTLHLKTDYIIRGEMVGKIFPEDPLDHKYISLPFDLPDENRISGSLFQNNGLSVYPMVGVELNKMKDER